MSKKYFLTLIAFSAVLLTGILAFEFFSAKRRLSVSIAPANAILVIDGAPVNSDGADDFSINLKPGKHKLSAVQPGHNPYEEEFRVGYLINKPIAVQLEKGEQIIDGLPYGDPKNYFYVYGYYDDTYRPTYKITVFKKDGEARAKSYLGSRGVNLSSVELIISLEYDSGGESAD